MVACLLGSYWKWQEPCPHRITFWVVISFGNGTQSYIYIDDSPIRELQNRTLFHPVPMEQIRRLRHPPSSDKPKLIQMTYDLEYVCWTVPNLFFKQRTQTPAPAPGRPRSFSSIHQEAAAPASQSWICPPEPRDAIDGCWSMVQDWGITMGIAI